MSDDTHESIRACPESEVVERELTYLENGGRNFLLTKVDGELRAYRNLCKHQFLVMEACESDGESFECPYHTVRYSLATGVVTDDSGLMGIEPLTKYDTEVQDGVVHLKVPSNERW